MSRVSLLLFIVSCRFLGAEDCPRPQWVEGYAAPTLDYLKETDQFSFEIDSASGAVGDVVGVTAFLHSQLAVPGILSLEVTVCHNPEVAEIVGKPVYTEEFLSLVGPMMMTFMSVNEAEGRNNFRGYGFALHAGLYKPVYYSRFPSDIPFPIMTVYYRLKGKPGDVTALSFCDYVLAYGNSPCNFSSITVRPPERAWRYPDQYLPQAKVDGVLSVVEGPATHPDRPPEPAEAKVYPARPTDGEVNFRVRISGANARPGDREVPVEVYATADVEYTGIQIPIDFDERYLRLARVQKHFPAGTVLRNDLNEQAGGGPEEGNLVVYSGTGINSYRIAAEGEEVHAATLYFDILDAAQEISETTLSVVPVRIPSTPLGIWASWIVVWYQGGIGIADPPVRTEISPISIADGALRIRPTKLVQRGDANSDGQLDLSDALTVLTYLFLGGALPECGGAADFNLDGELDITDPIAMLSTLFLGGPVPNGPEPRDVPCN